MMTKEENIVIQKYLMSRNLPLDIILEVKDHMISQIEHSNKQTFQEAFDEVKANWQQELQIKIPFYIIGNKSSYNVTKFEHDLRKKISAGFAKKAAIFTLIVILFYFALTKYVSIFVLELVSELLFYGALIFAALPMLLVLINNFSLASKKYENTKFSIFQWRTNISFALIVLISTYIKPIDETFQRYMNNDFSLDMILKLSLFFFMFFILIYTGLFMTKFYNVMKKLKPYIN